jgi:hypothetical protein
MKNQLLFFLSILILSSCAAINRTPLPYTKADKALTISLLSFQAIDAWQTDKLTHHKKFEEGNPVFRKMFGKQIEFYEISAFKAAILLPTYYFYVYKAKTQKDRAIALWSLNTISIIPVISNSIIGAEVLFNF